MSAKTMFPLSRSRKRVGTMCPLSRSRERARVRASLRRAHTAAPSAPPLIPAYSRKREKENGAQAANTCAEATQ